MNPSSLSPEPPPERTPRLVLLTQRALFEVSRDYLVHSVRRLRIPESDRADLLQEILVAAYRRRADYDAAQSVPAAWLRGFVANATRSYRRRRARYERLLRESEAEAPLPVVNPDDEDSVTAERRRILLDELLPQVPFEQRIIVIAHDLDELEMRVIAEQEEIPISTAYDRYHRGRGALDRAYARWAGEQKDRCLLLAPLGLAQLLAADRAIPPAPVDMAAAAWARFRKARAWEALRAFVGHPAVTHAAVILVGGVFGAALHAALGSRESEPPSIVALPPSTLVVTAGTALPETSIALRASATAAVSAVAVASALPRAGEAASAAAVVLAPRGRDSGEEDRALDAAQRAFDHGDLGTVLPALQRHERAFPRGEYAAERETLWVKLLIRTGQIAEARARLDRLGVTASGRALAARLAVLLRAPADAGPMP
ncbi:MAG: RNA polymerase sigma factor [Minicystis sp.]